MEELEMPVESSDAERPKKQKKQTLFDMFSPDIQAMAKDLLGLEDD